jgi:membrane-bound lytic murein transglycosylase D
MFIMGNASVKFKYMKHVFSIGFILIVIASYGSPRVPAKYEFAGIELVISEQARKQIQLDVDALHKSQYYLKQKVEKVDLFFPIIERVFREENLPDDFKYLTIQESALISDAVSSSNAVGFWQFKVASAREVGLTVDQYIDERMHITASSHAAAKYLKKNNFFFDNWVYALLAYNTGPTGAEKYVEKKYMGKKKMDITGRTHWYVKKFLSYKIAFEQEIHKNYTPTLKIYEYENTEGKSLKYLSDYFDIEHQSLVDYNKWMKKGKTQSGEKNVVIVPVTTNDRVAQGLLGMGIMAINTFSRKEPKTNDQQQPIKENQQQPSTENQQTKIIVEETYAPIDQVDFTENQKFPIINTTKTSKIKINGIPGFVASHTDDFDSVISKYGIPKSKFLKYNDLTLNDKIIEGQVYYLKAKRSKAKTHYHAVIPGETVWSISQKYGIKSKKLLTKNRMREEKELGSGMVLWLRFIRPADVPVSYRVTSAQQEDVKSTPLEAPQPSYLPPKNFGNEITEIKTNFQIQNIEVPEKDFLSGRINSDDYFIDENSYVDLKKAPKKTINDKTDVTISTDHSDERENVKKVELSHIVKSGETLFSISRTYKLSIGQLRQWNDIDDLDVLHVGQRIIIKKEEQTNATTQNSYSSLPFKTHKVKKEDTVYSIARQYDISIKDLMELNDIENFTISEGEELKVKEIK